MATRPTRAPSKYVNSSAVACCAPSLRPRGAGKTSAPGRNTTGPSTASTNTVRIAANVTYSRTRAGRSTRPKSVDDEARGQGRIPASRAPC